MNKMTCFFVAIIFSFNIFAQNNVKRLNVEELKLPQETSLRALYLDGGNQIKSSPGVSSTELEYISTLSSNAQDQIDSKEDNLGNSAGLAAALSDELGTGKVVFESAHNLKADDSSVLHLTGDESASGVKTFTGKIVSSSTTNGAHPCPTMTDTEMLAIASPQDGDCVNNSTLNTWLVYKSSLSSWEEVGGGGINNWETATDYEVGDVVIESNKIYQCNNDHTSGTFTTDIANWTQLANNVSDSTGVLPMANGGTSKNLTASNGAIPYSDADSLELLAPGTSGQILQTNGAAAPSFVNKSISAKAQESTSVTLEEIQVAGNQLTQVDTNKYLIDNCGSSGNILTNCGFEHSTNASGWTTGGAATFSAETSASYITQGKKSLKIAASSQTFTLTQDSTLHAPAWSGGAQGILALDVITTHDADITICPRAAGVTLSTGCTVLDSTKRNGSIRQVRLPVILGGTSNGVSVSGASGSGNTYLDNFKLEASKEIVRDVGYVGPWVDYGEMSISAVTTAPTKATVREVDNVRARQVGSDYEVEYTYAAAATAGGAVGSGEYIFNLPGGIEMDTTKVKLVSTTTLGNGFTAGQGIIGSGYLSYSGSARGQGSAIAYTSTSFRYVHISNLGSETTLGSGYASPFNQNAASFKFILKFPGKGLSATVSTVSERCQTDIECTNTHVAKVSATAVITKENVDFLNTCAFSTSGDLDCTFNSSVYSDTPVCVANVYPSSGDTENVRLISPQLISTTEIQFKIESASNTETDAAIELICHRAGTDFKARKQIDGTFEQLLLVAYLKDVKATTVNGGGSTATTWTARNLNTLVDLKGIVKNPSSFTGTGGTNTVFTLDPGVYKITAISPLFTAASNNVGRIKLRNTTDGSDVLLGMSGNLSAGASDGGYYLAPVSGLITVDSQKSFEIQYYVSGARATDGLGKAVGDGAVEVYTTVEIQKLR